MYTHPEKKRKRNKTALDPNNQHLTYIAQTQPNQPYRHSVQVPRLSPSQNKLLGAQRLTHRPQVFYRPVQQIQQRPERYAQYKLDTSLPPSSKQLKKITNQRVFETKGPTPRMTAAKAIQTQFEDDGEDEYIVIPTRTKKQHHYVTNYSDEQIQDPEEYEDSRRIQKISILSNQNNQPIKISKQTMIPIMVPASKNKTIQYIKNQPVIVQRKKKLVRVPVEETIQVEQRNIRNSNGKNNHLVFPNNVNYVQNQRHSHKRRSQHGPIITQPTEVRRHRRLATTAQLHDEQQSKTQTEDQMHEQIDRYQPQRYDQQDYQYDEVEMQEEDEEDENYDEEDEGIEGYEDDQYVVQQYQQYTMQGQPNFYKNKKHVSQKNLQKQIKARFKDIENIMQTQNQNLKDHNQYLLAVIKKMQSKDRKQRALIVSQNQTIKQITEERNAYMERCMQLQGRIDQNSEKGLNKHYSVLTLDLPPELANQQNSTASDANNQTVNFARREMEEREKKLGGLRRHLKNTISEISNNSAKNNYRKPVGSHMLSHQLENGNGGELHPYIVHSPTPKFESKKDSPQRKPRLTTKMSNSSRDSDPSSTIFNNNNSSEIMNNSNSFGGGWVNTNSGFKVIKTLSHNLNDMKIDDEAGQINEEPQSFVQESEEEAVNPDDLITAKNSGSNHKIRYATNTDEEDIQQLNKKFEELMRLYRANHDVTIRKQCVQIAKRIKEIKNQVEQNKQLGINSKMGRLESKKVESDMAGQITRVRSGHKRTGNINDHSLTKVRSN